MFEDSNISPMLTNLVESPMILLASNYTILDLNISAEQLFNTQKISIIGKDISLLYPLFEKKNLCHNQDFLNKPHFYTFNSQIEEKSFLWFVIQSNGSKESTQYLLIGSILHCTEFTLKEGTKQTMKSIHDEIVSLNHIYTGQIVDEQKSTLEHVKNIYSYMENIIAEMPGSVYWMNKEGVYLGCNNNLAKLINLRSRQEIVGKSYADLYDEKSASYYKKVDMEVMSSGIPFSEEEPLYYPDGSHEIYLSNKVPLRGLKGEIIGMLGISIDITQRKKMEGQLLQAKKDAEAANEAKSDFISNMQHDLMTPFSGIHGAADLLYAFFGDKYPELKEWLEVMTKSCDQWERVHYSMFDALKLVDPNLSIEKFYLSEEINKVTESMSAFLRFKLLKLRIPKSSEIEQLGMIESNRLKVHLILLSLVSNAIKFTDSGQVEVKVSCDEEFFSIQIEDTGVGIPSEKFEYIFEKFTKLSRSNLYAENFKGIGAGLYIARHQAHSIGGEIKVASDLGKGSIFTLLLPKSYKL